MLSYSSLSDRKVESNEDKTGSILVYCRYQYTLDASGMVAEALGVVDRKTGNHVRKGS